MKIVFGILLFWAVTVGIVPAEEKRRGMFAYAYGSHFQFLEGFGRFSLFLFAPVVIAAITQEFSQRTVVNPLTRFCGKKSV